MNRIFLDNAGTTRVHEKVRDAMFPFFTSQYTKKQVDIMINKAKIHMLTLLNGHDYDVFFTSSGSEANNIALEVMLDLTESRRGRKGILTSPYEHAAVYKTLNSERFKCLTQSTLPIKSSGLVDLDAFTSMDLSNICMSSTMYVNNELGTILPIDRILKRLKSHDEAMISHVDAVQALGHIQIDLTQLSPDFMTLSAHKIHGPKGIGALIVKRKYTEAVETFIGCQNDNLPYIMGFVEALTLRYKTMENHREHAEDLRAHIEENLGKLHSEIEVLGGSINDRVPSIINIKVPYLDGDSIVLGMDMRGIAVSSGSACSSGAMEASHVILALGYDQEEAKRCFRVSTSIFTSREEVDRMLEVLALMLEPYRKRQ